MTDKDRTIAEAWEGFKRAVLKDWIDGSASMKAAEKVFYAGAVSATQLLIGGAKEGMTYDEIHAHTMDVLNELAAFSGRVSVEAAAAWEEDEDLDDSYIH
jgi:hypothetical protein